MAERHGLITPAEVLALSNNVGAATIGLTLGGDRLYDALVRFGFGSPTGIDLAGEAAGVVLHPDDEGASQELTTAQNAFGQGISVTVVQMAAAYAAIANGGRLVTPHVVAGWTTARGRMCRDRRPRHSRSSPGDLGHGARDADRRDRRWDREWRAVAGYSIAGKTGTAQVAGPVNVRVQTGTDANGQPIYVDTRQAYVEGWVDSSFIGIAPASNPRFVMMVLIHRPVVGRSGIGERLEVAFAQLAPEVFDYFGIPRTDLRRRLPSHEAGRLAADSRRNRVPAPIRLDDLLAATGGRLQAPTTVRSFRLAVVDSRKVVPGSLFVALPGERTDGHRFVPDAPPPARSRCSSSVRSVSQRGPMRPWSGSVTACAPCRTSPRGGGIDSRCAWWGSPARRARRWPRRSPATCWLGRRPSCATRAI